MRELNGSGICIDRIGRRNAVPVIFVKGNHYEVGFDIGRTFSGLIQSFLLTSGRDGNLRQFEMEYKTETGREAYEKTLKNMKLRFPHYVKEIQGMADGAKVPFYQLFLLHLDDIIGTINENSIIRNDTGGCTSIAISNAEEGILGHTEDAFNETVNHFYIISAHIIPAAEDREFGAVEERFSSLSYAGSLPGYTSGFNEHGLVFSINTLSPAVLKPGNTPRVFLTRAMLASKCFHDAVKILTDEGLGIANGFSVNMIWTDLTGNRELYNIEVAPDLMHDRSQLNILKYNDKDTLVHVNRYMRLKTTEVVGPIIDSSKARLESIHSRQQPKNKIDITNLLSDQTGKGFNIFQDKEDAIIQTICAGIFDLKKKTWSLYIEKPNSSEPVAVLPITFNALDK